MKVIIVLGLLSTSSIFAATFEEADELFDRRGESTEMIEKATVAYEKLLEDATESDDLLYSVEQIGRLQSYRGQMIPETEIKKRKPYFKRCLKAVEKISPKNLNATTTEYLYWMATCTAQYNEAAGVTASLRHSKSVEKLLLQGKKLDGSYNGGGFSRFLGAIYSRLPRINPFGPAGDLRKALKVLVEAVKSESHESEIDPEYGTGNYYYETHYLIAEVYFKLGKKTEARKVIDDSIARIEKGDFSPYRKPETMLAKARLKWLKLRY